MCLQIRVVLSEWSIHIGAQLKEPPLLAAVELGMARNSRTPARRGKKQSRDFHGDVSASVFDVKYRLLLALALVSLSPCLDIFM